MIKKSTVQGDITILNIHISNNRASKDMRQKLTELQGEIDDPIIIAGDVNTPHLVTDQFSRQERTEQNYQSA